MVYLDEEPLNADWVQVMSRARGFAQWTKDAVDAECARAYGGFLASVRDRHRAYFAQHVELRSPTHDFAARKREMAFPPGREDLADVLAEAGWHRHHLSGGSSQVLAIALLSAARDADPTHSWLPLSDLLGQRCASVFELELASDVLNEHPRQTAIDFLTIGDSGVVAAEAKFTEKGFGTCSCDRRAEGICSARVDERPYWPVASANLGLRRPDHNGCPLSLAYQPVRNIAAAAAIAGAERRAGFVLLFDERNPYFSGSGHWPGWVAVLSSLTRHSSVSFASLSWQQLLARAPIAPDIRAWAAEKHGLLGGTDA